MRVITFREHDLGVYGLLYTPIFLLIIKNKIVNSYYSGDFIEKELDL